MNIGIVVVIDPISKTGASDVYFCLVADTDAAQNVQLKRSEEKIIKYLEMHGYENLGWY